MADFDDSAFVSSEISSVLSEISDKGSASDFSKEAEKNFFLN